MAQVPQTFLDALAVRTWCGLALRALGRAREEIDAINVYPVADGDTGTNLYLTVESAATAVEAVFAGHEARGGGAAPAVPGGGAPGDPVASAASAPSLADAVRAMAHGALIGARGNSGTILAQLLRGMAQVLAEDPDRTRTDGKGLGLALRHAADSARQAVAHPVEGTVLSVASAAADAARTADGDCAAVARAAHRGACAALARTPAQLPVLERSGVVDAGGRGLVAVLGALVETLTGEVPAAVAAAGTGPAPEEGAPSGTATDTDAGTVIDPCEPPDGEQGDGPAYEVIYLLEAEDTAVARLRDRLDALGDSLVVVGGDGLWNVHVHVDDAGAAVEAGLEAGRPYRIRITHFGADDVHTVRGERPPRERVQRGVVAVVPGEGLACLYADSGATTVLARPGEPPASGELVQAVRRAHAREVVLLPNDAELRHTAAAAAEQARAEGVRVALIPTRSAVQGLAALAVHEPGRRFDEDVVAMTSAAGATRYAEVTVAEHRSWTMAGICQAGDVLGLIDGDVAVIGADVTDTARTVLDRMLAAGGELVTLVLGDEAPEEVAEHLRNRVREAYLAVDTVVYRGGRQGTLLLIGVE
ncbi:DAK2 domain-containing protein [Streptomyces galbus]|uniref:DAK2 domain-containing protein n=1 Tax=Streptomyces galbus TaxID=33898 RepID=A0A4U5WBM3_STRGB|nr:DAK2 domain-containing protein [Streptomyces galbus]TKS98160.1 DAK2 domain-containing protein [Streptomyces galbus]GHD44033.1 dihydroxyacetone kinase [Streptomyces galbus]